MGKGRPRAIEKSIQNPSFSSSPLPQAPVFYPTDEEFKDPLAFIAKIRPQAEPFGICRIVPPKSWAPPFALDSSNFTFPTKTQSIHQLLARPPSCDLKTFELEYGRFVENQLGKKVKKRVIYEGEELDLCLVFNAVKRYGGYDKVCEGKKWGDVARFVKPKGKVSECAKHVLCQLYREHLYEYEEFQSKKCKRGRDVSWSGEKKGSKKRKKGISGVERVKEEVKEELDQICEQCKSGLHGEVMLLCDRCDKGWHLYCLTPPLESIPLGNWYCLECVNSDKDTFGFVPGKKCSLEGFRRRNDRAKRKWLGQTCTTRVQIEKRFWEIVEGKGGEVEVMYGSDLDTSVYGSGFPRIDDTIPSAVDPDLWKEYCSSPWNLNNLPKLPGSMLRAVHDNIAGVMVPWLYVGMLFSSFCWHVEDHCFYSINYLHWGEAKCWYGVPGIEASAFEQVMRNTLPDLFDAQPDLLFQLVTMLNPSVLQENGVSVYNVLQEPGNFVVTFPRSFHGGFNFGLNCAEAVNFAPADWLPHGGFGAEWYRRYHKAAVISHEELLCVVSKNGCDAKALPYLKEEMQRIFKREKKCRENLWKNGVVKSSMMLPRKHPMYVGTEEDPTCIICQQYLYLSAVTCSCRPSAFVCLEHWQHLCECNPSKHCLRYRQTLAELGDLIHCWSLISESACSAENHHTRDSKHLTKKVKGSHISYAQRAEDWLSHSCQLFEVSFSNAAYKKAMKEAEQFLWADHDMDPVRDMASRLMVTQKWAVNATNILSVLDDCLHCRDNHMKKVSLSEIKELLLVHPLPCHEPEHAQLKAYVEDSKTLICEIKSALLSCLEIVKLEQLYSRSIEFPIKLEETGELEREISSAKAWISDAARCLSNEQPVAIDIDFIKRVKSKMAELHVRLADMDSILNLCSEVDSWLIQCKKLLNGSIKLKDLKAFLQDADNVRVSIPELELLRQYHADACSWILHLNDVLPNLNKREDPHSVVRELNCILEAGKSLRVQVDEIPIIEAELKRYKCREKAFKALATQVPLDQLQQLLAEASLYGIHSEKLFMEISGIITVAISWEERAKFVLACAAPMSEFDDIVRASEIIFVVLPSLPDLKDALSLAQSWIIKCQPFLIASDDSESPLLKLDDLKELVTQSKHLKVRLEEAERLQCILNDVNRWEDCAHSLLEHSKAMLCVQEREIIIDSFFPLKVEELRNKIDSIIKTGQLLGLELIELPNLLHASSILHWILKALAFCSKVPLYEEINSLLEGAYSLPGTFSRNNLGEVLIKGLSWLRKAIILFPRSQRSKRFKLQDVEGILEESKKIVISYPLMVARLQNAIGKHKSWVEEAHAFFGLYSKGSWVTLMKLKDVEQSDAFDCPELDKVECEIEKVDKWMLRCQRIVDPLVGNLGSLRTKLAKVKDTLDKALSIYRGSRGSKRAFCVCCPNDSEADAYMCLTCEDRYHFSCMGPPLSAAGMTNEYACPFCLCMESGAITGPAGNALVCRGHRPEMKSFVELLSTAEDFCEGVQEVAFAKDIVKLGLECKSYLSEIVNYSLAYRDNDLSFVSESLQRALKAVAVAGVYDVEDGCNLDSAISKNSWKVRVKKLLKGSKKPSILHIQHLLKEGLAIGIPSRDHFMQEIMEIKQISLKWVEIAKKVTSDSGNLELSEVFKLISDGESLPVHFEKEMKSLRDRCILYCICRKPYDHKDMIACDQCDEWYHFDCINLQEPPPKKFFCPACKPSNGEFITLPPSVCHEERCNLDWGPHTPPAHSNESKRRQLKKARCSLQLKLEEGAVDPSSILKCCSEIDYLWRENRRPLKRTIRRPSKFERLSQVLHFPQLK